MVDMVDAVGDFKMFSEFMSLGGKFKQILVLAVPLNACEFGSIALYVAGLSPLCFILPLSWPTSIILP